MGYRDLLEVVQEHAVFERPSVFLLRVSAGSIVSPPSCNRRTLVSCNFLAASSFFRDGIATLQVHGVLLVFLA